MSELLNKAVLCKISISQFNPKRQDSKTTAEVLEERNARRSAGNWVKNLIDPKSLDSVVSIGQQARLESYRLSLPWQDEGYRILPIMVFMEFQSKMREHKSRFEQEVERFVERWDSHVDQAKIALSGMFNPNDYPTKEQVREKFGFYIDILPLPCGNDFRINIAQEELEEMKQKVDTLLQDAERNAMKDLWNRLATPIRHMVDKLSKDSIFRDSLVENVQEILTIIPALNITDSTELNSLVEECKVLTKYPADVLRINRNVRKDVVSQAEEILHKMEGYL